MRIKQLLAALVLLFGLSISSAAQQREITGKITAEDGSALAGASVSAKGSRNATSTNAEGEFKLSVPANITTLIITYINYETIEVSIDGRTNINASLKALSAELENVVVTVLGFRERSDKVGSSSSKINADDVVSSGETGLLQGMAGKASGVLITRSTGDPGCRC